ncbi:fimbrial protein [Klebsiella oxytoca]|uniref:fimbrial protein n=1 Tax=Klebsiella oxytoca TaxID=571 RepID=UPI00190ED13B|nr:fimbrial protein [Klebsiella oxytoca]
MKVVACASVAGVAGCITPQAAAGTYTENLFWASGDAAGQHAATCNVYYPDEKPLAVPRTLVVDQNTPDGTVLFQWGYGEFMSDTMLQCVSSGISNSTSAVTGSAKFEYYLMNVAGSSGIHGLLTSDSGIQLKILARYNAACAFADSYIYLNQFFGDTSCLAAGTEVDARMSTRIDGYLAYIMTPYYSGGRYQYSNNTASLSLRAALVKQGTVSYSSALNVNSPSAFYLSMGTGAIIQSILATSATRIVPPACQLRTADYTVPMNTWLPVLSVSPAYGPQVPIHLSLECSGPVDHVRFRFEDTGTSLSGNNNISLYDTAGGNKIDGLEIELLYNGTKVNVDNTTLTDTGSHGASRASPASLPLYDSVSTAVFQARYVQSAPVTQSGTNYTGPVTGKVNMYVIYD